MMMSRNPNRRKWLTIGVVFVVAAGGIASAVVFWPSGMPDPEKQTGAEAVAFMASEEFEELSEQQQDEYRRRRMAVWERRRDEQGDEQDDRQGDRQEERRKMGEAYRNLTEEQRERLHENAAPMFIEQMERRLDAYFALSPDEKQKRLDQMLDWEDAARQRQKAQDDQADSSDKPPDDRRPGRRGGRRGGFNPEGLKRAMAYMPPEVRAKFAEFFKDLDQRRAERKK